MVQFREKSVECFKLSFLDNFLHEHLHLFTDIYFLITNNQMTLSSVHKINKNAYRDKFFKRRVQVYRLFMD